MNKDCRRRIVSSRVFLLLCAAIPSCFSAACAQSVPSRNSQINLALDQMEGHLRALPIPAPASPRSVPMPAVVVQDNLIRKEEAPARVEYPGAEFRYEGERKRKIETSLRQVQIELSLEYMMSDGKQQFVSAPDGVMVSRLKYQNEGTIPIVKGEVKLGRFAIGGRYGGNTLDREICTDEDWGLEFDIDNDGDLDPTDYNIDYNACSAKVRFWDANLYYTLIDRSVADPRAREILLIDNFSLDIFGGYQWYRGRYAMLDPEYDFLIRQGDDWYYVTGLPADRGLNSPYKITYQGPRVGLRLRGTMGRVTTKASFALARLKTRANGYWNLRDYTFWHYGDGGYGIDFSVESTYAFTPSWSAGIGYNFIGLYQRKMKATGHEAGSDYYDEDWIRDAENQTHGASLIVKYIW